MIYNEKYKVYVNKDGVCLKYVRSRGRLELCGCPTKQGYISCKQGLLHRIMWETFVGEIPYGYEIDHIDNNRSNNALNNLQLVNHKQNIELSYKRGRKITDNNGRVWSEFGRKFKEHFGITKQDNNKLYQREKAYYHNHNHKCRWET